LKHSVLVLGRTGMLGQACIRRLQAMAGWVVGGTQRSARDQPYYLDLAVSSNDLERELSSNRWEFIVNAVGVLRPLIDLQNVESVRQAIRVNAVVPHEIAAAGAACGARIIHISTDAVFGGSSVEAFTEANSVSPSEFYGMTKGLGESDAPHVLNLRTSIVGRDDEHHRGLVEWLLGHRPGSSVNGFVDYVWSAATTAQVAELCASLVQPGVFDRLRTQSPVFHFAPNPPITKFEFLRTLADVSGSGVSVRPVPCPGGGFQRMLATKFDSFHQLFPSPRSWSEVIADALDIPSFPSHWFIDEDDLRS
jgi:dTDP-4-dehydrorhamnose reductase